MVVFVAAFVFAILTFIPLAQPSLADSLDVRVSASANDAEQRLSNGVMRLTSSDLELVIDGAAVQAVGIRFTGVTLPRGAIVTNAYVQFTTHATSSGTTSLVITGEAADNSLVFTTAVNNISTRAVNSASVSWSPPAWTIKGETGTNQRTPDLSPLIQAIVNRPGWVSGNALTLIVNGSGSRTAKAYNTSASLAPLLHIDYGPNPDQTPPSVPANLSGTAVSTTAIDLTWDAATDDTAVIGYTVFRGGAQIATTAGTAFSNSGLTPDTSYSYSVSAFDLAGNNSAQPTPITVRTLAPPQDTTAPSVPQNLAGAAISATEINLTWDASTDDVGVTGYTVFRDGTQIAAPAGTSLSDTGLAPGTTYLYRVSAQDAAGHTSDQSPEVPVTTPDTTSVIFETRIAAGSNDAEEPVTGTVTDLASSDLELVTAGSTVQVVGIRFTGVAIPKGAIITRADVQFTVDETTSGTTALTIKAHASDNSAPFSVADNDISGRSTTTASAAWTPAAWTTIDSAGQDQRTPDVSAIVQQVVNRPGWASGNALTLIITGSGSRVARAFESGAAKAALLHVEYGPNLDTELPTVPANLAGSAVSSTRIDLTWSASTDDSAVAGYKVFRGGSEIATVIGTAYANSGLTPDTAYSYAVSAFDLAGNDSAQSTPITVSTPPPPPDLAAPSVPQNLAGTAASDTQINLTWDASTDDVGVTGYNVFRGGTQIATTAGPGYPDTGLTASTTYSYRVSAFDAAGRESAQSPPVNVTTLAVGAAVMFAGAGDIASSNSNDEKTAVVLDQIVAANPAAVIHNIGDNSYPDGGLSEFNNFYGPTWGRHKARTRPSPGNHEYHTANAQGYFDYFGASAGPPGVGYYSYDIGAWHIVSLNSEVSVAAGSAQEQWLRADLLANAKTCTLAYWHKPRFSSLGSGSESFTQPLWQALYEFGADIVLSGHVHAYERFARQTPSGSANATFGIRQFVVGTGGISHSSSGSPIANSEVRNGTDFGVLALTLHPSSYDWEFKPIAGGTFTDMGSTACSTTVPP